MTTGLLFKTPLLSREIVRTFRCSSSFTQPVVSRRMMKSLSHVSRFLPSARRFCSQYACASLWSGGVSLVRQYRTALFRPEGSTIGKFVAKNGVYSLMLVKRDFSSSNRNSTEQKTEKEEAAPPQGAAFPPGFIPPAESGKKEVPPILDQEAHRKEEEEREKKKHASRRAMRYTFLFLGTIFVGATGFLLFEWGSPRREEDGSVVEDEFSELPLMQQYLYRTWNGIKMYNKMIQDPSRDRLLPDPLKEPYYQPPYTLVLEMKDVLVHPDWTYQTGWRFKKRPGVDFFLQQIAPPLFEVVIYTSEQGFTAFPILDSLDNKGVIMYRLFRDATRYLKGTHVKDLSHLNRDLSKVIMVDYSRDNVQLNPRNALVIPRWEGNDDDRTLIDLAIMLRAIATANLSDVREVLDHYRQYDDPVAAFREIQRMNQEQQAEIERQQRSAQRLGPFSPGTLPGSSWSPASLFGNRWKT